MPARVILPTTGLCLSSVAGYTGHRLSIGDQRERAIPLARPAIQEPEVQVVRLPRNGGRHAHDDLEVPMHAIALEIALDEREAARPRPQLTRRSRVAEIAQMVPGERRVVVVAEVLL